MRIIIDTETNQDPTLLDLYISDENALSIEINFRTSESALQFKRYTKGHKGIYEMDSVPQNFTISYDYDKKVRLIGNINNAFKILAEQNLISESLASTIRNDSRIQKLFKKCENFILDSISSAAPVSCSNESTRPKI